MKIPKGWRDGILGDLVQLRRGHDLPARVRLNGDVEVIGGGGPNGYHNEAKAPAPGIVIGRSGSGIGNAFWSDKPFWPLNTGLYVTDYLGNNPEFCFLWLDWLDFKRHNSGGAQPSLNRNYIYPIPLPIPPLLEQERVATIIGTWNRAIAATEVLIAQSETQKKALMQQLLTGKRRLPGFEGDWREVNLGDVVSLWKGKQKGRAELTSDGPIPVINGGVSASGYTEESNAPAGTITISEGGNSCGYVALQGGPFWCGGHCYALLKPKMEINFLFAQLKHSQRQIMRLRVGSGLPNIQKKDLSQLKLLLPSVEEQKAIGELFSACDFGLSQLQTKLQTLKTEKAALMQQLLTGKRRVKLTEVAA